MMKGRRLQACSLRHSIKKACFLFRANWTCLSLAGGETSPLLTPHPPPLNPPPPPTSLGYVPSGDISVMCFIKKFVFGY